MLTRVSSLILTVAAVGPILAQPARVSVTLPADAKLFVENQPCPLKGTTRAFSTPSLTAGTQYEYELRIEIGSGGTSYGATRKCLLKAGETVAVHFGDADTILRAAGATPRKPEGPTPRLVRATLRADSALWLETENGPLKLPWGEYTASSKSQTLDANALGVHFRNGQSMTIAVSVDGNPVDSGYKDLLLDSTVIIIPTNPKLLENLPRWPMFGVASRAGDRCSLTWIEHVETTGHTSQFLKTTRTLATLEFPVAQATWKDSRGNAQSPPTVESLVSITIERELSAPGILNVLKSGVTVVLLPKSSQ